MMEIIKKNIHMRNYNYQYFVSLDDNSDFNPGFKNN